MDNKSPALLHVAFTRIRGNPARRLMVVLKTRGCTHALKSDGGCTFCGFRELSAGGAPVSGIDIVTQFEKALSSFDLVRERISEIDIYNCGSFLAPMEVPDLAREGIFGLIAGNPKIEKVLIESRPEFIVNERAHLKKLRAILDGRILEVGVGLETVRDDIRVNALNKGFTLKEFGSACEIVAGVGADLLVYVLVKPPGLSEADALRDALDTFHYLEELRRSLKINIKIALQPTFIPKNSVIEHLYFQGEYTPPKLWTVIEIVRGTFLLPMEIQVGLSDEGLAAGRVAYNCEFCQEETLQALERFNETQDRKFITSLKCPCKFKWKEEIKQQ